MPRPMPPQPCHDAFGAAQVLRAQYPLTAGASKLREARQTIARLQATMCAIHELLQNPESNRPGVLLGLCCTTDDMGDWLKNLPKQVADLLGYDILPAIAALTGNGIAETDIKGELASANAHARNLLQDCEKQYARLQAGIEREYRAMKTGLSGLHALLVDADGIARRALELIDWCEARARYAESDCVLAGLWD